MKNEKIIFLSLVITTLLYSNTEITFRDVLKESLKKNLDIQKIVQDIELLKIDQDFEYSGYNPNIAINLGMNRQFKDQERDSSSFTQYKNSSSINLTYSIDNLWKIDKKIEILNHEIKIKEYEICQLKQDTTLKVLDIYANLYETQLSHSFFEPILEYYKKLYILQKKLFDSGIVNYTDTLSSQYSIYDFESRINRQNTRALQLKNTLLNEYDVVLPLDAKLTNFTLSSSDYKVKNPTVQNIHYHYQQKVKKINAEIAYFKLQYLPEVNLFYNNSFYNESDKRIEYLEGPRKRDYQVGFNITWNTRIFMQSKFANRKRYIELQKEKIEFMKNMREFKKNYDSTNVDIKETSEELLLNRKSLTTINDELTSNQRLYHEGFEYQSKILESIIKELTKSYDVAIQEFNKKRHMKKLIYLTERENICIVH